MAFDCTNPNRRIVKICEGSFAIRQYFRETSQIAGTCRGSFANRRDLRRELRKSPGAVRGAFQIRRQNPGEKLRKSPEPVGGASQIARSCAGNFAHRQDLQGGFANRQDLREELRKPSVSSRKLPKSPRAVRRASQILWICAGSFGNRQDLRGGFAPRATRGASQMVTISGGSFANRQELRGELRKSSGFVSQGMQFHPSSMEIVDCASWIWRVLGCTI